MNFDLDENQELFKATAEKFNQGMDIAMRHKARAMDNGFDNKRWQEMSELGLIAIAASEDDGGLGGSVLDCAIIAQTMGEAIGIEPWLECGFLPTRLMAGCQDISDIISGNTLYAFAFAESNSRYNLNAKLVNAAPISDGYSLSGEKQFVMNGAVADMFIVSALMNGETQLFTVPRSAEGVNVKPYPIADGSFAAVLTLHNAPADALLSDNATRMQNAINDTRIMACAEMIGLSRRLFNETLEYLKTREQFGQPIGRFQALQHRMVDCYEKLEQMQSSLYRTLLSEGTDRTREIQGTKAFVSESAILIAQEAVQLHGGMGLSDELIIGHGLKRILLLSRLFGDPTSDLAAYAKAA